MRAVPPVCFAAAAFAVCGCESENARFQENPVPAIGQNAEDMRAFDPGKGPRILFVGNSITLHGPRPEIGWTDNRGMAATLRPKTPRDGFACAKSHRAFR